MAEAEKLATVKSLTTEHPITTPIIMTVNGNLEVTQELLTEQVRRSSNDLFPLGWYSQPSKLLTPSTSGHINMSRPRGGALGSFIERGFTQGMSTKTSEVSDLELYCPNLRLPLRQLTPHVQLPPLIIKQTRLNQLPNEVLEYIQTFLTVFIPTTQHITPFLRTIKDHTNLEPSEQNFHVEPVALKEPFKVRIITTGPESQYYICRYIQKATHKQLRACANFAPIGEPLTGNYLNNNLLVPREDEFYVSGDYTGATNNINPGLSEACANEISRNAGWTEEVRQTYIKSLTGHHFNLGGGQAEWAPQKWGQLMGSPTSFPILCIINLALTRYAFEISNFRGKSTWTLEETHAVINGDDIGFVADQNLYNIWKQITAAGGLTPSMGKNFCSKKIYNSEYDDALS